TITLNIDCHSEFAAGRAAAKPACRFRQAPRAEAAELDSQFPLAFGPAAGSLTTIRRFLIFTTGGQFLLLQSLGDSMRMRTGVLSPVPPLFLPSLGWDASPVYTSKYPIPLSRRVSL